MTFSLQERQVLLTAASIGPKMVGYIELASVGTLRELARSDARDLALRINAALGKAHINRTGIIALGNVIAVAWNNIENR